DVLVERSQIVTVNSVLSGQQVTHYGLVDEVYRSSQAKSIAQELNRRDGRVDSVTLFETEGISYARVAILRSVTWRTSEETGEREIPPGPLAPPREDALVTLATPEEARAAYRADEMENPLAIGLVKNGGSATAGPGFIDLDYLLGINGGHLNVNGAA